MVILDGGNTFKGFKMDSIQSLLLQRNKNMGQTTPETLSNFDNLTTIKYKDPEWNAVPHQLCKYILSIPPHTYKPQTWPSSF